MLRGRIYFLLQLQQSFQPSHPKNQIIEDIIALLQDLAFHSGSTRSLIPQIDDRRKI